MIISGLLMASLNTSTPIIEIMDSKTNDEISIIIVNNECKVDINKNKLSDTNYVINKVTTLCKIQIDAEEK